jgi:3-hydroxymyristoyl/3-hydroxydecanoyl-(acyl carrier protein) dehydratase
VSLRSAAVTDFKFPAAAGPGAVLEADVWVVGGMGRLTKIEGRVTADGQLVAAGAVMLADAGQPGLSQ